MLLVVIVTKAYCWWVAVGGGQWCQLFFHIHPSLAWWKTSPLEKVRAITAFSALTLHAEHNVPSQVFGTTLE